MSTILIFLAAIFIYGFVLLGGFIGFLWLMCELLGFLEE